MKTDLMDFSPAGIDPLRIHRMDTTGRLDPKGRYVLYWCQIFRRPEHNHALNCAVEWANHLELPVVVYEALRHDYPWASDRIHVFMIEGARESAREFRERGIPHFFLLERKSGEHQRALQQIAGKSALVVTDFYPCFIMPRQTRQAAEELAVPLYAVDSCGVVPLALLEKEEYAARTIRPKIHKVLDRYLKPVKDPVPRHQGKSSPFEASWALDLEAKDPREYARSCDIDHSVPPSPVLRGGFLAARRALLNFVKGPLEGYAEDRNHPDREATSGLSPYLHFGHIFAGDAALAARKKKGVPPKCVSAFLEELIVRRELSYNFAFRNPRFTSLESLPPWIQRNLEQHAEDERERLYGLEQFERAETHDEVWNAAQRQLVREGRMHNYIRMVWGKKIIEWSASYETAFQIMVHLNNKYALDGRDPNSWTGILWCFGKHDRAWQTTPVLGKIRPMSTANARRKLRMEEYLRRFGNS